MKRVVLRTLSAAVLAIIPAALPKTARQAISKRDIEQEQNVLVPMRDGVRLAADVFVPGLGERWPTVLVRTPYGRKASAMASYGYFVRRGYAVVVEDVRGRYGSGGVFAGPAQEGKDGSDTIDWIAEQRWSNGRVGMVGSSYLGIVQWWAAAEDNPHLVTIAPMSSGDDEYLDRFYSPGGALQIGHRLLWVSQNMTPRGMPHPLFTTYIRHLPVKTADLAATGVVVPIWRNAIAHPSYDEFWAMHSIRERIGRIRIPVLSMGGWFDDYGESDLDAFARLAKRNATVETWIGPWAHNSGWRFPETDFGADSRLSLRRMQGDWFDRWMKTANAAEETRERRPVLHIFVTGANTWREEHEWPLARTRYTPLYLDSGGRANSAQGDGSLQWQPVRKAKPDVFTYDPKNPVPTTGGAVCCDPAVMPPGPLEQTQVENRRDVLVYTSGRLTGDLEVTGPVRAVLYVATSANDTDFTAKLVDVEPDGRPVLVTDGIQRLRYRLSLDKPVFVKRNAAYQISVDAGVTSHVFLAGHRIRVEISSSNFPRFDRNLNSSRPNGEETKFTKARQTVFHEKGYPSSIVLPVIPMPAVSQTRLQ